MDDNLKKRLISKSDLAERISNDLKPALPLMSAAGSQGEGLVDVARAVSSFVREVADEISRVWQAANKVFGEEAYRAFEEFTENVKQQGIDERIAKEHLAVRGWYLTGNILIGQLDPLVRRIVDGNYDGVDEEMADYARTRIDDVEFQVCKFWGNRSVVVKDAFSAHRAGMYTVSIPALLAQAEGISNEILGVSIYSKVTREEYSGDTHKKVKVSEPATKKKANELKGQDKYRSGYNWDLDLLEILFSINYGVKYWNDLRKSDPSVSSLNRHAVMHGLDTEYGTEENGLRVILILDFLCDLRDSGLGKPMGDS